MRPDVVKALGSKVRFCREADHITQTDLAERAGLPILVIRRLEQGVSAPPLERLVKIADALNCRLADLFTPLGPAEGGGGADDYDKAREIDGIVRMLRQHGLAEIRSVRSILREVFQIQRLKKK